MKNIIPFKKDVIFKTNLSEITSISLENTLNLIDDTIKGDFIVNGEYKISDKSTSVEPFELKFPFEIVLDERFDTKKATVDIDDFYYEIINDNVLSVSIDVLVDHLQEKPIMEVDEIADVTPVRTIIFEDEIVDGEEDKITKDRCIEEENIMEASTEEVKDEEVENKISSIFNTNNNGSDVYVTYNVFIIRDGDTLDSIMEKYNITEEELKKYNDISNLKLGDKLIIPNKYEAD